MRIGWIGLGIMGKPMARNLMRAGYRLSVFNRSRAAVDELAAEGAEPAASPAEVARRSDRVFTMVTDSPDVEQVVLGPQGVLEGARPGTILVDMSTISPEVSRRVAREAAARGILALDAPVSGGDVGAREGTLSIMVGGDREAFDTVLPLLQVLGRTVTHVGPPGSGQEVKLVNQIVCGLNLLAMAEGLAYAEKAGLNLETVLKVITKGAAGSWMLSNLGPKVARRDFAPGFMVRLQQKDLRLALEAAAAAGQPLPGTALVQQLFRHLEATGRGDEGTQALAKVLERLGGREEAPGSLTG
ncbi:2-hydroxy-3-oxopropionate reductase [Limnochorda pilosa]|uniref:2-hydroxy-3-oxopropionate reductase n=1 Tax=Limnochorda pilosa TaxID=1555112 RepID=UPI001E4E68F2|nr:2-hydroxy-3-oxopropionate reductase [Limnochorda pilosa]